MSGALPPFPRSTGPFTKQLINDRRRNVTLDHGYDLVSAVLRKAIYTTNAIESLNATVRRAVRARGHFTSVGAAKKLMYMALREASAKWSAPMAHWDSFKREFAIHFDGRFNPSKGWFTKV